MPSITDADTAQLLLDCQNLPSSILPIMLVCTEKEYTIVFKTPLLHKLHNGTRVLVYAEQTKDGLKNLMHSF